MRRLGFVLLIVLLMSVMPSGNTSESTIERIGTAPVNAQSYIPIERNWTANVILVGYDPSAVNEAILLGGMPGQRVHYTDTVEITYNIHYELTYADASYAAALNDIVLANSVNGTGIGTFLNETELSLQRDDPNTPRQVFYPRDGMSIDGYAVEDWLMANPYVTPPGLGYNFYLLNLSSYDSPDHSLEHWFDYHPIDPDTGETQDWFRLEFDHDLNPPVMMEYPGIGGRGNVYALDPSADQWYLRWARIWWRDYISTEYEHWTKDLDQKASEVDLSTPAGVDSLSTYLRDYVYDIMAYLLFPFQHQPAKYVSTAELKVNVICMDVAAGVSVDSLRWVTDAARQKAHLEELYPFIEWNVEVHFLDIDQEPMWNYTFWRYAEVIDNITHVDGGGMFNYIYDNVRPSMIEYGSDIISIFGVVFIKADMLMHYAGNTYTGLGYNGPDGGQTVIWKSLERYYRSDGVTPKEGISSVQLHESMHAVGFGHTWLHEHYAGDFGYGPMGYFAFHNGTSSFDKDWVQGTYLDQMEAQQWKLFLQRQANLGEDEREVVYTAQANAILNFERARDLYNQMRWLECYDALSRAAAWSYRMMWALADDVPPVIEDWGTVTSSQPSEITYWAEVSDDYSGLENVTLHVQVDNQTEQMYSLSYSDENWSVVLTVPAFDDNVTMWIVARDWGMNQAIGGVVVVVPVEESTSPTTDFLLYAGILTGLAAATVVILLVVRRRRT
ncbi:MAG: hypothetical protein ACP6KW_09555 [Candidatus Thorarchaeota archaeon]